MATKHPMESGRGNLAPLDRAAEMVATRGKLYLEKERYTRLIVFTTKHVEADFLRYHFGGRIHKHKRGFTWVLAKHHGLRELYEWMSSYPEFQIKLKELLMRSGRSWERPPNIEELRRRRREA